MKRTTLEFGELRATLLKGSIEQFCLSLNLGWRISNRLRLDVNSVEFTLLLNYDGVQDGHPSNDPIQDPEKRKVDSWFSILIWLTLTFRERF